MQRGGVTLKGERKPSLREDMVGGGGTNFRKDEGRWRGVGGEVGEGGGGCAGKREPWSHLSSVVHCDCICIKRP